MKRLLIANRGEIALRIVRACREEGIETVAVFSDADRGSPHVQAADRAVSLGPPTASESYLRIDKLLDAANDTGADAVHPGYGFLAERADFADAVANAGLTFVGPSAAAIRAMGEKTSARALMQKAGIPVVPGTVKPVSNAIEASRVAEDLGYPVLLKAVAGGGGKGMRVVRSADELESALAQARSEATKAFGNGDVYVEKLIARPRHIEIQILADTHGRTVHYGERECSVQRRHQKLIEEAPSSVVDDVLRERMGDAAVRAAQAVDYVGAGTIEFLLDDNGHFYFLEMNTRIQVEHPVTELVYGIDLVREQLRIAAGHPIHNVNPVPRGHAIECRITSEDPFDDFLPATGRISELRVPTGPGVRWDAGVEVGSDVGLFYDSLLAKLITWGETRDVARRRMSRALRDLVIVGVSTSQTFHTRVMDEPEFAAGAYDIGYFDTTGQRLLATPPPDDWVERVAVATALLEHRRRSSFNLTSESSPAESVWLHTARRGGLR